MRFASRFESAIACSLVLLTLSPLVSFAGGRLVRCEENRRDADRVFRGGGRRTIMELLFWNSKSAAFSPTALWRSEELIR